MRFKLKHDKYKASRGPYSRLLQIFCQSCGKKNIAIYQKDGRGNLRRLYFDRIFLPNHLSSLESKPLNKINPLKCPKCKEILGTPVVYRKENRKAFRLYQDAVTNKIVKNKRLF